MSGSVNKVIILGTLGKDPEIRTTPSGKRVANFSVATNESWRDGEGNVQKKTEWHRIVLWGGLVDIAEKYLKKGSSAYFEGKLSTQPFTPADGIIRYNTSVVVKDLQLIGSKPGNSENNSNGSQPGEQGTFEGMMGMPPAQDEDLPF